MKQIGDIWLNATAVLALCGAYAGELERAEIIEWMRGSIDGMPSTAGESREFVEETLAERTVELRRAIDAVIGGLNA